MDPNIRYPSLATPSELPPVDPQSRLCYPDPVSIESITDDLSKAQVSPVKDASETILVTVAGAIAHLIDPQASVHLATGPFSLVRLNQGGNGIAVFARVGEELQWPLTKDQASVKLDPFHYFFSLIVPPEIEEECRSSPEERSLSPGAATATAAPSSSSENLLNYGITFSPSSDAASLQRLDEVLKQYSFFTAPQVAPEGALPPSVPALQETTAEAEKKSAQSSGDGAESQTRDLVNRLAADLKELPAEEGSAEYWTLLAPNVEDYSSSVARAIASGAGQIIRVIFWCSEATVAQLEKGNLYMKGRLKSQDTPTKISPSAMQKIRRARKISVMSEQIVTGVLSGVVKAAAFITRPLVTSKAGQKLLSLMPGQIALASLDGFGKIFDALEIAGKNVLTTTSVVTTGLVSQRYGNEAGELTQEGFNTAGGFLTTAWTVSKLRKVFYPSSLAKSAAKVAGDERNAKSYSDKDGKDPSTKV